MRVLIVDDSVVFRTQIANALGLTPEIEVVGTAASGSIALQKLEQLSVDVVTLDMEMPEMNGLDVLREIRKRGFPVRVIIFSSQTPRGAESALTALREGADDVVSKPSGEHINFETARVAIQEALTPKILQFKTRPAAATSALTNSAITNSAITNSTEVNSTVGTIAAVGLSLKRETKKSTLTDMKPKAIVIGCSTGGPAALEAIFSIVKGPIQIPIFIVQHMPPVFTEILARRLGELSAIPACEARSGMVVASNAIYVAPGNFHMTLKNAGNEIQLELNQKPQRNSVRPAVDYLFESAASVYQRDCLAVVLTGMGEDGLVGARAIRANQGYVVIQDKDSCVVFGMPGAIHHENGYDDMGNLEHIGSLLSKMTKKTQAA